MFCQYCDREYKNIKIHYTTKKHINNKNNRTLTDDIQLFSKLPIDLVNIVYEYYTLYDFLDWIIEEKLDCNNLSKNTNAVGVLSDFPHLINWYCMVQNPNAGELLLANDHMYDFNTLRWDSDIISRVIDDEPSNSEWMEISRNPAAIKLLLDNKSKICWPELSSNPAAIDLLRENKDKIYWYNLSSNPAAIDLLRENKEKIDWIELSSNPAAIDLLRENKKKIDWHNLSLNPAAIDLLRENKNKINWCNLSSNPSAISLLEENKDKIDWEELSLNPAIFTKLLYLKYDK